jgi:hypothetical protein
VGNSLANTYVKCGALRMLDLSVEQDAILKCGYLDRHDVGTCEMWARTGALEFLC